MTSININSTPAIAPVPAPFPTSCPCSSSCHSSRPYSISCHSFVLLPELLLWSQLQMDGQLW
ncbi:hypothetical protein WMY93_026126 [Mugilogobius chulae]|uniref:Uncharacterized protein n=1 Tax=Mugilogobius chulae TaxID=88201 RepID=A0AAW0N8F6_9GOBI